jgi:hypothetical protein
VYAVKPEAADFAVLAASNRGDGRLSFAEPGHTSLSPSLVDRCFRFSRLSRFDLVFLANFTYYSVRCVVSAPLVALKAIQRQFGYAYVAGNNSDSQRPVSYRVSTSVATQQTAVLLKIGPVNEHVDNDSR